MNISHPDGDKEKQNFLITTALGRMVSLSIAENIAI